MRLIDLIRNEEGDGSPKSLKKTPSRKSLGSSDGTNTSNGNNTKNRTSFLQADDLVNVFGLAEEDKNTGEQTDYNHTPEDQIQPVMNVDLAEKTNELERKKKSVASQSPAVPPKKGAFRRLKSRDKEDDSAPPEDISDEKNWDVEEQTSNERKEDDIADALHIELLSLLDEIYAEGEANEELSVQRLIGPLHHLIELNKNSNALLRKAVRLKKGKGSFTSHSLNLAILASKIGQSRGYSDERVFSLALCSLLCDIGMTWVPSAILNKSGKLTSSEFNEIRKHVDYSVEIVSTVSSTFPFLPPIINQIHERENGSGYPLGLKGENIHEFAKIIGLCDVYVALTESKANRAHYSGYVALQQIISRRGVDFNAKIIKSLIDVISVFPLESLVKLNNGAIGRVIDVYPVHPTRPKLKILINSDGEKLTRPKILDLEAEPLLYIEDPDIEEGVIL